MFGLAGAMPNINNFGSKADALKFAIEFTSSLDVNGARIFDKEKAQELFGFICKSVDLPDTPLTQWKDVISHTDDIAKMIKEYLTQIINSHNSNANTVL